MLVTLSLALIGTEEDPHWAAWVQPRRNHGQNCCDAGHLTPEEAASHGGALTATWLARHARSLAPPACGALAIQKLEAVS